MAELRSHGSSICLTVTTALKIMSLSLWWMLQSELSSTSMGLYLSVLVFLHLSTFSITLNDGSKEHLRVCSLPFF